MVPGVPIHILNPNVVILKAETQRNSINKLRLDKTMKKQKHDKAMKPDNEELKTKQLHTVRLIT